MDLLPCIPGSFVVCARSQFIVQSPEGVVVTLQAAAAGGGTMGTTIIGTYGYMAPEQFRGAAQPASDLYALGGTLLFLLSGTAADPKI